jgi:predicted nucleotidyltransferase
METQEERNRKIIRAVTEKAERVCPGSLALVGVNGSFATGQAHPRSDLDLLIVVNDRAGDRLASAFVQRDMQAAHDLYCMSWDRLRQMARYENPHIAKLMDAKIVWSAGKEADDRLAEIRAEARARLSAPLSSEDFAKAEKFLGEAERCFAKAFEADSLSDLRTITFLTRKNTATGKNNMLLLSDFGLPYVEQDMIKSGRVSAVLEYLSDEGSEFDMQKDDAPKDLDEAFDYQYLLLNQDTLSDFVSENEKYFITTK